MIFGQISWLVLLNKIICSIAKAVYAGVDERKFQRMEFYVYLMVNHQGSCFRPNITLSLSLSHSLALSLSRSLSLYLAFSHTLSFSENGCTRKQGMPHNNISFIFCKLNQSCEKFDAIKKKEKNIFNFFYIFKQESML